MSAGELEHLSALISEHVEGLDWSMRREAGYFARLEEAISHGRFAPEFTLRAEMNRLRRNAIALRALASQMEQCAQAVIPQVPAGSLESVEH